MPEEQLLYKEGIDIPSLRRNWPDGHELPQVIIDIAMLLESEVRGSARYLEMIGSRFDDYWIEGGADLCEQFGMFLHCPDGTRIAQWFHREPPIPPHPQRSGVGRDRSAFAAACRRH
jgi:hypothetical protein